MDVDSTKHFGQTEFTGWPEAAAAIPLAGIPVSAEKHVPHRKIRIVEGVNAFLMMYAVALRTLKEVSEPIRGFHVPVINEFCQAAQNDGTSRRTRFNAYPKIQKDAHEHTVE